jgi:hypothetical protein
MARPRAVLLMVRLDSVNLGNSFFDGGRLVGHAGV